MGLFLSGFIYIISWSFLSWLVLILLCQCVQGRVSIGQRQILLGSNKKQDMWQWQRLECRKVQLNMKNFFVRVIEHWNRLPREAEISCSLEVLKAVCMKSRVTCFRALSSSSEFGLEVLLVFLNLTFCRIHTNCCSKLVLVSHTSSDRTRGCSNKLCWERFRLDMGRKFFMERSVTQEVLKK